MATTQENATFSAHVYGGANAPALPDGWALADARSLPSGFYAEAYRNTATGEIVIAYRGTEPGDGGDRHADYGIASGQASPQFSDAMGFAMDVISQNPSSQISATGHSLGGALAQYVSGVTGITGETFNAPGIKGMSGLLDMIFNNVVNWVVPTDLVGNFGNHVGSTNSLTSLPSPFEAMALGQFNLFLGFAFYAYQSHLVKNFQNLFRAAEILVSPIVLDLDGDGITTTGLRTGIYFDHDANGFAEQTGWVNGQDGILVRDLDNNGTIDTGRELFGSETLLANGQKAANGYDALAELDTNQDGKIDAQDAAYATLKIWKDANGDGYSSADELDTLADAGVQSVSTSYTAVNQTDTNGNTVKQTGSAPAQTGK